MVLLIQSKSFLYHLKEEELYFHLAFKPELYGTEFLSYHDKKLRFRVIFEENHVFVIASWIKVP